jgi:hypothetical protein
MNQVAEAPQSLNDVITSEIALDLLSSALARSGYSRGFGLCARRNACSYAQETRDYDRNIRRSDAMTAEIAPIKRLLDHDRDRGVWLFEVIHAGRAHYQVECGDRCWHFNLLYSALGKFERLSRARKGGSYAGNRN